MAAEKSMTVFWEQIVEPLLEVLKPRVILELGAGREALDTVDDAPDVVVIHGARAIDEELRELELLATKRGHKLPLVVLQGAPGGSPLHAETLVSETQAAFKFIRVPLWPGIGIAHGPHHVDSNPALAQRLSELEASATVRKLMAQLEARNADLRAKIRDSQLRVSEQKIATSKLAEQERRAAELQRRNQGLQLAIVSLSKQLEAACDRLADAERRFASELAVATHARDTYRDQQSARRAGPLGSSGYRQRLQNLLRLPAVFPRDAKQTSAHDNE